MSKGGHAVEKDPKTRPIELGAKPGFGEHLAPVHEPGVPNHRRLTHILQQHHHQEHQGDHDDQLMVNGWCFSRRESPGR